MLHVSKTIQEHIFSKLIGDAPYQSTVDQDYVISFFRESDILLGSFEESNLNQRIGKPLQLGDHTITFSDSTYCIWVFPDGTSAEFPFYFDDEYVYISTPDGFMKLGKDDNGWVDDYTYIISNDGSLRFIPEGRIFKVLLIESTDYYLSEKMLQDRGFLLEHFSGFVAIRLESTQKLMWFTSELNIMIDTDKEKDPAGVLADEIVNLILKILFSLNNPNSSPNWSWLDVGPFPKLGIYYPLRLFLTLNSIKVLREDEALLDRRVLSLTVRGNRIIEPRCK